VKENEASTTYHQYGTTKKDFDSFGQMEKQNRTSMSAKKGGIMENAFTGGCLLKILIKVEEHQVINPSGGPASTEKYTTRIQRSALLHSTIQ